MEHSFITEDECQDLAKAMDSKYRIALKNRGFFITAKKEESTVQVCVLFKSKDESFYYPVEGRVLWEVEEMTPSEAALFLIDYIDIYFEEFLLEEEERLYLPIDWQDFEHEAVNFQVKAQMLNKKLDDIADRLLEENVSN